MVPPGLSAPVASAASTIRRAMRSFTDPPGFMYSTLASTVAAMPSVTTLSLTRGVFPTRSAMCSAYFTAPSSQTPDSAVGPGTFPAPGTGPPRPSLPWCTTPRGRGAGRGERGSVPWAGLDGRHGSRPPRRTAAADWPPASACSALAGYGLLKIEATMARRIVGRPFDGAPDDDGPVRRRVAASRSSWSSSATARRPGMGADEPWQTVGAIIANGVSALSGRPVRLTNVAVDRRGVLGAGRPAGQRPGGGAARRTWPWS